MLRTCRTKNTNIYENEDEEGVVQEEDKDDIDAKIDKLLDHFSDSDQLERTQFLKTFDEKNRCLQ